MKGYITKIAASRSESGSIIRGMDLRIRIRIHAKISWIRNTLQRYGKRKGAIDLSTSSFISLVLLGIGERVVGAPDFEWRE